MRFGSLDFILMVGGELVRAQTAIQSLPSIVLNHKRFGCQLSISLGPQQSRENQRRLALSNNNDVARPSGEGHLSPEPHVQSTPTAFPFGLRNATATARHLVALRMVQPPADSEFMGVIKHDMESLHKILTKEPGRPLALTPAGGAITLPGNASWWKPLRGMLKASLRGRLP